MKNIQQKTWVELSQDNLKFNLQKFRERVGEQVKIMAVVKSNAYGHGVKQIVQLSRERVDFYGVDSINEALEIREEAVGKPILILGYTMFENLAEVIGNRFHQVVANLETLQITGEVAFAMGCEAYVHLKIETGTARQGIFLKDLKLFLDLFAKFPLLKLAGVSTHFANIEDTTDDTYARKQLERYKKAVDYIEKQGFNNFIKHTACSAAAVIYPETHFDLVRIGISMYGLWSAPATLVTSGQINDEFGLKPVLTWKTVVVHIKNLPAGSYISYGCTEKVEKNTKVAVLPIGYRDGYDRKLSGIGEVLIQGKRCKILGRVCMNMVVVNVDHLPEVKLEDEVVLIGKQGDEEIITDELANKIGTINYEIVTRINNLIERRF